MHAISLDFETRRGRLQFYLLPRLSIKLRYLLAMLTLLIGASLTLRVSAWIGVPIWIAGLALVIARSTSNVKISNDSKEGPSWIMAAPKELRKIRRKLDQTRALPNNPLNGASGWGMLTLILAIVALVIFNVLVIPMELWEPNLWGIISMEVTLVLALFFSTLASAWEPDLVKKKLDTMEKVRDQVQDNWQFTRPMVAPMLLMDYMGEAHPTPTDLKLFIRFEDAPEEFLGIQVQMTFNRGPNGEVPYLYCVLLAKDRFAPMAHYSDTRADASNTIETGSDGDINYLVVRQTASNKGGYETKPSDINRLLDLSMQIAAKMLHR